MGVFLGWTPQIIRTTFFCRKFSRCKLIEPAITQTWISYDIWGITSALYRLSNVWDSNDLRTFMLMPLPLVIYQDILLRYLTPFNLPSIIIPKHFTLSTSWILTPHIWSSTTGQISIFTFGQNIIKLDLSVVREGLLAFYHCMILSISWFTVVDNSCTFWAT